MNGATELLRTHGATATYAGFANLVQATGAVSMAGGASSSAATTCSCIYIRNSMTPFYSFEIADRDSGRNIDEFTSPNSPGLCAQLLLGCQPPEFWTGTQSPDQGQSESKADLYGATVRTFRDERYYFQQPTATTNTITPEGIMPLTYVSNTTGGVASVAPSTVGAFDVGPVAYPQATTFCTFPEVQQQQMKLWASSAGAFDGMPLRTVPISDLLNENELQYGYFNKYLITFTVNNYNNAVTDFLSTLGNSGNTWTYTQNATTFNLYNCRMMIYYYECNENVIQRNMTLASSPDGIQIPFSKAIWKTASWPASQGTYTISINQQNITNLERVIFIFRNTTSVGNTGGYDTYMFRNMSSGFIAKNSSIPPTVAQMLAVGNWKGASPQYNGLNQFFAKWQMIQLPSEQITYIAPYQFARMKEAYAGCFAQPKDTHVSKYLFEGIDQNGWFQNCTTQFCIALDLRTVPSSEKAGISLSKSPLDVTFITANTPSTTNFQVDYLMLVGACLHVSSVRVWMDN